MKKVTGYEAIRIAVDCEENDSVDIKAGGPPTLGYDFYVDPEKVDEIINIIRDELHKQGQSVMSISARGTRIVKKVWTKDQIQKCIKEGYPGGK